MKKANYALFLIDEILRLLIHRKQEINIACFRYLVEESRIVLARRNFKISEPTMPGVVFNEHFTSYRFAFEHLLGMLLLCFKRMAKPYLGSNKTKRVKVRRKFRIQWLVPTYRKQLTRADFTLS
jgi:hypothetical protein